MVEMVEEALLPSALETNGGLEDLKWEIFVEKAGIWEEPDFVKSVFVDHLNTTRYTTDYLWYTTRLVLLFIIFIFVALQCMKTGQFLNIK